MALRAYSLGIDIGGTFTDIVAHDGDSGRQYSLKQLTTHEAPERAVVTGIKALLERYDIRPAQFGKVVHATTLFTNALIERSMQPPALITTLGFRDTLEIGHERKFELYDLDLEPPHAIVPRHLRVEVNERMRANGDVAMPLDRAELEEKVRALAAQGVGSIAVSFLHSYANPGHEKLAAEIIAACAPDVFVSTSHEVVSEIREFERTSTTVANAYVKPLAQRYLDGIADEIEKLGIEAPLFMMLSNGGLSHIAEAKRSPVRLLESGPAAGALAAAFFGELDRKNNLLAFDMGGTTAKLSLIDDGRPLIAYSFEAARQKRFIQGSGLPIRISTIELIEIGTGGGSIARRNEMGLLKVGPESAGSQPGPASYGLGGVEPTVTDANFMLGYLDPEDFGGGSISVDLPAAQHAVDRLGGQLSLSALETAWGIREIADESMASAARVHIAERARDPRNYALLCTGGGGPLHGYSVARKLGVKQLVCPVSAGTASALGLLVAPARVDRVATVDTKLDTGDLAQLEAVFRALEEEARAVLREMEHPEGFTTVVERSVDARCIGQGFSLVTPLPAGPYDREAARACLREAVRETYRENYGRFPPPVPIEFLHARVSVSMRMHDTELTLRHEPVEGPSLKGSRKAYFSEAGDFVETPVHDRHRLAPGDTLTGPLLIEDDGSTLVVGPGARATVLPSCTIVVTLP